MLCTEFPNIIKTVFKSVICTLYICVAAILSKVFFLEGEGCYESSHLTPQSSYT